MATPTSFKLLRNEKDVRTFAAGETIFSKGDPGDRMYAVIEGEVDIVAPPDRLLETVPPGGIFGEMALLENCIRNASAVARTDCRLAAVGADRFNYLVQMTPNFALDVMRTMADRLRRQTATNS